jgi:type IV pilus assembly protein PilO
MDLKLNMNFNVDSLPPTQRKLLLILPPVLIVALFVYLLIMPAFNEKTQLLVQLDKQTQDIAALKQNAASLPALKRENERLKSLLSELQMQLPEEKEVSGLLKQVSEQGIKSGLQIALWRPTAKNVHSSKEVYEIPVEVEMRGTYHLFGQFFSNITKLGRIVNLSNIVMRAAPPKSPKDQLKGDLNVTFTSLTYSVIPEKEKAEIERIEKEKAAKEKEKKKK